MALSSDTLIGHTIEYAAKLAAGYSIRVIEEDGNIFFFDPNIICNRIDVVVKYGLIRQVIGIS